jgi:Inhibitor of vertebrate lysozyme (Ivy)
MRANSYTLSIAVSVGVLGLVLCGCGDKAHESATPAASQPSVAAPAPEATAPAPAPVETAAAPATAPVETAAAPATAPVETATAPAELPPLFDQIEKPEYKAAYLALFTDAAATPAWMREGGTASPGRVVTIGGAEYELYSHCKPHDCGDNMMYVLFSRDRQHAWALAVESGKSRVFGNPDAGITAFLKGEACKDHAGEGC